MHIDGDAMRDIERELADILKFKIRCARIIAGYEQTDLAELMNVNQSKISRYESGRLSISLANWMNFSEAVSLSNKNVLGAWNKYLDDFLTIEMDNSDFVGKFRIPRRYARNRTIAVRLIIPLFELFQEKEGKDWERVFKKNFKGLSPYYFYNLDNSINLVFVHDLINYLEEDGSIKKKDLNNVFDSLGFHYSFKKEMQLDKFESFYRKYFGDHLPYIDNAKMVLEPKNHLGRFDFDQKFMKKYFKYLSWYLGKIFNMSIDSFECGEDYSCVINFKNVS